MSTDQTSEGDIRNLLDAGASDEAICDAFDCLLTSQNGPMATVQRMAAAGFILARRPHLSEPILEFPVFGYLMHGNTRPDGIIRNGVAKSEDGWVQKIAGPDGVRWLRDELPKLEGLLSRLLWETEVLRWLETYEQHPPMTEEAWLTCEDAGRMWEHLRGLRRPPHRKLVLLAAEVCQTGAKRFCVPAVQHAVIRRFENRAEHGFAGEPTDRLPDLDAILSADEPELTTEQSRELAPRLRDIFGNPFHPSAFATEWRTDAVVSLAHQMYESRDFSPIPILGDALQEAGCEDQELLGHCYGPGPHCRGCWVVDLVLGKE